MEFQFEIQALHDEPIPPGLSREDKWLYICLREIYRQMQSGTITRDTGISDKQRLVGEYDRWKRLYQFGDMCSKNSAEFFKNIESAMNTYRKNRTLENADILVNVIDGIGIPKEQSAVKL